MKRAASFALASLLLTLAGCNRDQSAGVQAQGKGSIAAGRDVVIGKNTVINEYDTQQARKIEATRFARGMNRECTQYLERLRGMQLKREKGDYSGAMTPAFFGPTYALPDTQRLFGNDIYRNLNAQSATLQELNGEVFKLRQQYAMASAYAMMAQYTKRDRSQQRAAANPAPTETEFQAKKGELVEKTEAHCEYLKSLM